MVCAKPLNQLGEWLRNLLFLCFQHFVCRQSLKVWANTWKAMEGGLISGTENGSTKQDRCSKRGCQREWGYEKVQEKLGGKNGSTSLSHLMGPWWGQSSLKQGTLSAWTSAYSGAQTPADPRAHQRRQEQPPNTSYQFSSPSEEVLRYAVFFPDLQIS